MLSDLQCTYDVKACEVIWDSEEIHGEIRRLVERGESRFE
jgi:hypothetical protein